MYNTTHRSICSWVNRFNAEGVEGLKDRPCSGRPSRLSGAAKAELKQAVLVSLVEHGFSSGTWTWALVAEYIRTTFGVSYKKAQIYNILHQLGLNFRKGRGFLPKAEGREEAVSAIKKTSGAKRRQRGAV
ncbi:MAG: helix-turn-helix domain-containing protein [Prevotellaceae bacterium]|nr:helix-turn-helix domain-containing protein [Prevotellaceae bacterium]